jgi:hypothetical protein
MTYVLVGHLRVSPLGLAGEPDGAGGLRLSQKIRGKLLNRAFYGLFN